MFTKVSDLGVKLSAADCALWTAQLLCRGASTGLAATELVLNDLVLCSVNFKNI